MRTKLIRHLLILSTIIAIFLLYYSTLRGNIDPGDGVNGKEEEGNMLEEKESNNNEVVNHKESRTWEDMMQYVQNWVNYVEQNNKRREINGNNDKGSDDNSEEKELLSEPLIINNNESTNRKLLKIGENIKFMKKYNSEGLSNMPQNQNNIWQQDDDVWQQDADIWQQDDDVWRKDDKSIAAHGGNFLKVVDTNSRSEIENNSFNINEIIFYENKTTEYTKQNLNTSDSSTVFYSSINGEGEDRFSVTTTSSMTISSTLTSSMPSLAALTTPTLSSSTIIINRKRPKPGHQNQLTNFKNQGSSDHLNKMPTSTKVLPTAGILKKPHLSVPSSQWIRYNKTWFGHKTPLFAMAVIGRLGNIMCTYATLLAISNSYNVQVFMMSEVQQQLQPMFPHLTMSPLPVAYIGGSWLHIGRSAESLNDYTPLQEAAAGLRGARTISVDDYPCEMQLFNAFRNDLLQEFTFKASLRELADSFLRHLLTLRLNSTVESSIFIGVHARRTDYIRVMQRKYNSALPGKDYIMRAMSFYKDRVKNPIFVASSDDMDYLKENFAQVPDIFFTDGISRENDLAILSACNHTIMTAGTYGFWAGYLAGGTVIYPDIQTSKDGYYFTKKYFDNAGLTQFIPLPP